ncbi:unnamed protein product [Arctia plantaginis]|uniref:Sugar phosphate transporter domain-containing protein n=1 Tax=Arctia plantaginis TaxID=874455 RepID=A0A8S1AWH9_ARCPL|nr:unnamed protein product [Arctia plantaginis]
MYNSVFACGPVKATTPLWKPDYVVLFGERQTRGVQLALVVIALGVGVASATELQFDALGLGAALLCRCIAQSTAHILQACHARYRRTSSAPSTG